MRKVKAKIGVVVYEDDDSLRCSVACPGCYEAFSDREVVDAAAEFIPIENRIVAERVVEVEIIVPDIERIVATMKEPAS